MPKKQKSPIFAGNIFISMMNKTFVSLVLSLLLSLSAHAQQDRKALRDSLKLAVEALAYHPDSVDLRLRKAAWNMQLGEWQYAKDEYDWVMRDLITKMCYAWCPATSTRVWGWHCSIKRIITILRRWTV